MLDIVIRPSYWLISMLLIYNPIMHGIIMQILSQVLVLLVQQSILQFEQGREPSLCAYYTK